MEEWSGTRSVQRGGTREAIAVAGVGEGCGGWRNVLLLSGAGSVVCTNLEPEQALTPNTAQLQDRPGSEQQQDVLDGERMARLLNCASLKALLVLLFPRGHVASVLYALALGC